MAFLDSVRVLYLSITDWERVSKVVLGHYWSLLTTGVKVAPPRWAPFSSAVVSVALMAQCGLECFLVCLVEVSFAYKLQDALPSFPGLSLCFLVNSMLHFVFS